MAVWLIQGFHRSDTPGCAIKFLHFFGEELANAALDLGSPFPSRLRVLEDELAKSDTRHEMCAEQPFPIETLTARLIACRCRISLGLRCDGSGQALLSREFTLEPFVRPSAAPCCRDGPESDEEKEQREKKGKVAAQPRHGLYHEGFHRLCQEGSAARGLLAKVAL